METIEAAIGLTGVVPKIGAQRKKFIAHLKGAIDQANPEMLRIRRRSRRARGWPDNCAQQAAVGGGTGDSRRDCAGRPEVQAWLALRGLRRERRRVGLEGERADRSALSGVDRFRDRIKAGRRSRPRLRELLLWIGSKGTGKLRHGSRSSVGILASPAPYQSPI